MKQAYNPYLPLYEYVPDGEPHVFNGRVYIYGSHDYAGGGKYCMGDYVTWSAPIENLGDWRYEGVSYKRTQDPSNKDDKLELWAPDVTKACDGKYYMYYCCTFLPEIGIAVSNSPKGPFEFYGHVKYPDSIMGGKELNEYLPFDPAIFVDDDGKIYLYYGFSPATEMKKPTIEELTASGMDEASAVLQLEAINKIEFSKGGMVAELESDMVTLKGEPHLCLPGGLIAGGTDFEGHGFFEASSMRKINGSYYYIYSSQLSHELCYAISHYPDKDFTYGGTIISNGDIGYQGNVVPRNMMGNNHGSIVQIGNDWYIFYHRQTHGTESSRQGCAEKIHILSDGRIPQAEMTSCGLSGGSLKAEGTYPAAIACYLTSGVNVGKITYGESLKENLPYIFEEQCGTEEKEHIHYIANIKDGVTVGYKYFDCKDLSEIRILVRGNAAGNVKVLIDMPKGETAGSKRIDLTKEDWTEIVIPVHVKDGVHAIYFTYEGEGSMQLREIKF